MTLPGPDTGAHRCHIAPDSFHCVLQTPNDHGHIPAIEPQSGVLYHNKPVRQCGSAFVLLRSGSMCDRTASIQPACRTSMLRHLPVLSYLSLYDSGQSRVLWWRKRYALEQFVLAQGLCSSLYHAVMSTIGQPGGFLTVPQPVVAHMAPSSAVLLVAWTDRYVCSRRRQPRWWVSAASCGRFYWYSLGA